MKMFMFILAVTAILGGFLKAAMEVEYATTRNLIHENGYTCECLPKDEVVFRSNPDSVYRAAATSFYERGRYVKVNTNYIVSKNY